MFQYVPLKAIKIYGYRDRFRTMGLHFVDTTHFKPNIFHISGQPKKYQNICIFWQLYCFFKYQRQFEKVKFHETSYFPKINYYNQNALNMTKLSRSWMEILHSNCPYFLNSSKQSFTGFIMKGLNLIDLRPYTLLKIIFLLRIVMCWEE